MIRNQWYAILESSEVKPGKPVGVTRLALPQMLVEIKATAILQKS